MFPLEIKSILYLDNVVLECQHCDRSARHQRHASLTNMKTIKWRCNKTHKKLFNIKKSDPRSGFFPPKKQVYLYYNCTVVDMKRNQKYPHFNKFKPQT